MMYTCPNAALAQSISNMFFIMLPAKGTPLPSIALRLKLLEDAERTSAVTVAAVYAVR